METAAGVLEPSVTMQQWMGIWIVPQGLAQGIEYELVVVTVTDYITYDSAIEKVENGAQVELSRILPVVELKLGYVRNPFLVRTFGMKVSCQYIFGLDALRVQQLRGCFMVDWICSLRIRRSTRLSLTCSP